MSELAERLNSLVDSAASDAGVERQIVVRELAEAADLSEQDIEDVLDGDMDPILPIDTAFRVFGYFDEEVASELAGLSTLEDDRVRLPQIREVIPRSTYESLQAIKKELSQALAD